MSKFIELVVRCRDNLKRRRFEPGVVQIITLTQQDEEAIAQLEYTLRMFGCKLESLLGNGAPSTSDERR